MHYLQKKTTHVETYPRQTQKGRRKYYRGNYKRRLFLDGTSRKTVINTRPGRNTLYVVGRNPVQFITRNVQRDITHRLLRNKIHIAPIQDTNMPFNSGYSKNDCKVFASAAILNSKTTPGHNIPGQYIAGASVAIHQDLAPRISTIQRIGQWITKIPLDREEMNKPVTVLVTYAPRRGYSNRDKKERWGAAQKQMRKYQGTTS